MGHIRMGKETDTGVSANSNLFECTVCPRIKNLRDATWLTIIDGERNRKDGRKNHNEHDLVPTLLCHTCWGAETELTNINLPLKTMGTMNLGLMQSRGCTRISFDID